MFLAQSAIEAHQEVTAWNKVAFWVDANTVIDEDELTLFEALENKVRFGCYKEGNYFHLDAHFSV